MVTTQNGGPQVIDQILSGNKPPARDVLNKFSQWSPTEQVFACRKAVHEAIAPTLRGDSQTWENQPDAIDDAVAMLDAVLQRYEQLASPQARSGSQS